MRLGWTELLLILVIVLVIFGGSKLSNVGSALGKSIKDFKREVESENVDDVDKKESENISK